jgi:hypothetical protein
MRIPSFMELSLGAQQIAPAVRRIMVNVARFA